MVLLRSLLFNLFFFAWTTLLCLLALPLLALGWRANNGLGHLWSGSTLAALRVICGLRSVAEGRQNLPAGPCIVAMKHQSAWDTMAITQFVPDTAFVLKRELTRIPLFGWYLTRARMVAVDRTAGARALKQMIEGARARVAEGRPIVIYPEGTRTAPGAPPSYHPGVAALYLGLNLPVVPVAVNSGAHWGRHGFRKRPGTIRLRFLEPLPPGLDRRRFMAALEQRIEEATRQLLAESDRS